MALKEAVI